MRLLRLCLLFIFISSCSTAFRGIDFRSNPIEAEVYVLNENGREELVGKTPLNIDDRKLDSFRSNILQFRVKKKGYVTERLSFDTSVRGDLGSIEVRLEPQADWSKAFADKNATFYLEEVASNVADIQGSIAKKNLPEALKGAENLNSKFPKIAVGWVLKGNILYLQNRRSEALIAYKKALGIKPEDSDIIDVIKRIETER